MDRNLAPVFPNFIYHQRGDTKIWIARKFAEKTLLDLLTDADRLFAHSGCQIIKDQKKIKVGRLRLNIGGEDHRFYLKRYNVFSWRHRLGSIFSLSGAIKSLRGAAILQEARIPIAMPVATVESRVCVVLNKSFFLTQEIDGGKTADAYWIENLTGLDGARGVVRRRSYLAGLAGLFRSLHAQQIYHNDLKDANILVAAAPSDDTDSFYLLDLEGVRRYSRLTERRRIKNLVQLYRTLGKYIRAPAKMYFLKCYLGPSFLDLKLKRHVLIKVIQESSRLNALKDVNRSGGSPLAQLYHG